MNDRVIARYVITHYESGGLQIEGPIENKVYSIEVLEHAKDAVRNHHLRREGGLIVPGSDTSLNRVRIE